MQHLLPDFTFYLLVTVGSFLTLYLLGHLMMFLFIKDRNSHIDFYKKLSFGFLISITFYAIFLTGGKSIFVIGAFLLLFVGSISLWKQKNQLAFSKVYHLDFKLLAISLAYILPIYSLTYYSLIYHPAGGIIPDYVFYSNACHYITSTGVENPINSFLGNSQDVGPYHYHYSQIILTSLIANIFNLKYYHVLVLVVFTIIQVYIVFGAIALIKSLDVFRSSKYLIYLFSLLLLLSAPIIISNSNISILNYYQFQNFYDYPKLGEIYILYILFFIYLIEDKYLIAICSLLFLVPFYTPTAPGILTGSLVTTVAIIIYKKFNDYRKYKTSFIITLLVALGLASFYFLFTIHSDTGNVVKTSFDLKAIINPDLVLWIAKRITKLIISLIPTLFFTAIIIIILRASKKSFTQAVSKKSSTILIFGVLLGFLVSVITAALFKDHNYNAAQIYTNFLNPFLAILVYILLLYLINGIRKKRLQLNYTIALIGIFSFNTIYFSTGAFYIGDNYYSENRKNLQEEVLMSIYDERNFAYFRNYQRPDILMWPAKLLPYMSYPLSELVHIKGYYMPVCLSLFNITDETYSSIKAKTGHSLDYRRRSALGRHIKKKKELNQYENLELSIMSFIMKHNIGYIIIENGAIIPAGIESIVRQTISSEDYTFLILD